jgi:endonuclease/exonuclease/phosphatase (EEP) superfamily protein YafD
MSLIFLLLRLAAAAFILGITLVAVLALFGFAVPEFDLLNHLQVLIFIGTIAGLLLLAVFFRNGPAALPMTVIAVLGVIASGVTYVPEALSAFAPRPPLPTDGRPVLKAMTHNVFGLNYDMERVAANIFAEDPDIVALQEYFIQQRGPLHPLLLAHYPYFAYCTGGKRANIALYSKLPFKEDQAGACNHKATAEVRTARLIGTFTLGDGTSFSVMTTHLDWPYPAARQRQQMDELVAAVATVSGPLIVVGDMNSTPWSYALRELVSRTGLTRQTRNLITWPLAIGGDDGLMRTIPFLPLDQVLTRGIAVHTLRTGADDGSDHLPVVFTFSVEK